jgi:hypothetical protein
MIGAVTRSGFSGERTMTRHLAALALVTALAFSATRSTAADDPKLPDVKIYDKLVIDALRDVHNKGADLYNTQKDFAGAYRMYQGALTAVRPLLAHRPDAQKLIDAGLDAAEKEADVARKAFLLHDSIEGVRKYLKVAIGARKPDEVKKPEDKKKPADVKKPEEKKKAEDKTPVAPSPKEVKPKEPKGVNVSLSGKVTLEGKPLAGAELTFTSLDAAVKKTVQVKTADDGTYKFAETIPAGKYGVGVTGKGVPAKFKDAGTSGITTELKAGKHAFDIVLK